jgi:Na+/citrate or Na+/malate symporter
MIIALVVMKICNIVPVEIQFIAQKWYALVSQTMTYALMVGCGIALLSIQELLGALGTVSFFVICLAVVATAAFAAGAVGMLVKFYFVESALTAGLCMANQGGTGDVACLSAAHRMNLMPFAQMSSRLGGALILIIQSILLRMFF